ncbi:MAG TPA: hypothetical protein VF075_00455 [Pyrinomonadaceae bacterium]
MSQGHTAEFDERHPPRFFGRHSRAQIVFDVQGQMVFYLFGEFALAPLALEHSVAPNYPTTELS